jgi:hypothetical protein
MNALKLTRPKALVISALVMGLVAASLVLHAQNEGASMTIKCVQKWRTPQTLRADVLRRESDECYREGVRASEPTFAFGVLGALGAMAAAVGFAAGRRAVLRSPELSLH